MQRFPRYRTLFFGYLLTVAVFASLIKAENLLSTPVNYSSQRIPVTIELILDHVPEYSIAVFPGHDGSSLSSNDSSGDPAQVITHRNACVRYAQTMRVLLTINARSFHTAVSLLLHRSLPGKSSDDDFLAIS
jgi:hypothetical protein